MFFYTHMLYLLFSIFSSTLIFMSFKVARHYSANLSLLITINYFVATLFGVFLSASMGVSTTNISGRFILFAFLIGILFIILFYLIGKSTQAAGLTITTLANKLSLVFPVLFSIFWFNEALTPLKFLAIFLAFAAVVLTLFKTDLKKSNFVLIVLPLTIFVGSGVVDSLIKYVQSSTINTNQLPLFTSSVFFTAFLFGILILIINNNVNKRFFTSSVVIGIFLGIFNFGSLYFLIQALEKSNIESARVFTINNIGIVSLSALIGTLIFGEKLSRLNYFGILLSIVSLYFLVQ